MIYHTGLRLPPAPLQFGLIDSLAQVVAIAPLMIARLTMELESTTAITMKILPSSV